MSKYHIPYDFILPDGENELHEKVDKDSAFSKHYQEFNQLIAESISDNMLRTRISEAFMKVYISAEIAAYKLGFKEGIKFLINTSSNTDESKKSLKREKDFKKAFEMFLAEYRMDRIADTHDFLENNAEYKKIHSDKTERENVLQAAFQETNMSMALLDYITVVENLIDNVKTMFYEHGFQDCATVFKTMQEGLNGISLRTLLDLDVE